MGFPEKLTANSAAIKGLFNKAAFILAGKRQASKVSDVTAKVGNYTLSTLTTFIRQSVLSHLTKAGLTAHAETASQLGLLTNKQLETGLSSVVPQEIIPISRYGSLNYLPPGLTGTFDSGTTAVAFRTTAGLVEDDGSFVYLRNGTNGSTRGVYYAYRKDVNATPNAQPTRTNRLYAPAWFPVGYSAQYILACSDSVIMGRLQDVNGVAGDYFIALTNGTMDDTKHTGGLMTPADFAAMGNSYGEAMVAGGTVCYFGLNYNTGSGPLQVFVWTLPLATLVAANGTRVTFTKVTGWTTTGFRGITYAKDQPYFCDKILSTSLADNPMVHQDNSSGVFVSAQMFYYEVPTIISFMSPDGTKIRTKLISQARLVTGGTIYSTVTFSWTLDLATKVCKLDEGYDVGNTIKFGDTHPAVFFGPVFAAQTTDLMVTTGLLRWNMNYDTAGNVYRNSVTNITDTLSWHKGRVTNFTNRYEAIKCPGQSTVQATHAIGPQFGSALGSNIQNPRLLDATTLLLFVDGARATGAYQRGNAYTLLEGEPDYTYASLYLDTLKGYKPSGTRRMLSDMGVVVDPLAGTVNEVTGTTITLTGKRFVRGLKMTGAKLLKADFSTPEMMTFAQSAMDAIAASMKTKFEAALGLTMAVDSLEVVIPNGGCPPFALYAMVTTSGGLYHTLARVSLQFDATGNVIGVNSVGAVGSALTVVTSGATNLTTGMTNLHYGGNVAIYKTADSYLIGLNSSFNSIGPGYNHIPSFLFRFNIPTDQFVTVPGLKGVNFNYYATSRGHLALPGKGLGVILTSITMSDDATKCVWQPMAKDTASFDAYNGTAVPAPEDRIVLAAQNVAEGFMVYFSEETPLVLGGRYFLMPVSSVDLSEIKDSPGNSTYYVYARVVDDEAVYYISTTTLVESASIMFLGTITTNASNVTTINVEKVTRLGNYRINARAKGLSIPISEGLPSQSSHLEWR